MSEEEDLGVGVSGRLMMFLLFGLAMVFVGVAVLIVAFLSAGGSGSVGGVILIGPIPIVFGAGPDSTLLIIISAVLAVLSVALFVLMSRRKRSG